MRDASSAQATSSLRPAPSETNVANKVAGQSESRSTVEQLPGATVDPATPGQRGSQAPIATASNVNARAVGTEVSIKHSAEATDVGAKQDPNVFSRELWDEAYDSIEAEEEDLMKNYIEALRKHLGPRRREDISVADALEISAQLNNKTARQKLMEEVVVSGKERIEKSSHASKFVSDVAQGILKLQPVVDIVMQVPQAAPAALPWAGVCVGLQVSNYGEMVLV